MGTEKPNLGFLNPSNKIMCKGAEVGVEPDPLEKRRVGKQLK